MTWTRWCMVAYTVAMIGFGAYGTWKAGEPKSLIGGLGAGLLVLAMMFWSLKNPRPAYIIALLIGVAVCVQFGLKFLQPGTGFYPAGIIVLMNVFLIAALLGGHLLAMASKKAEAAA